MVDGKDSLVWPIIVTPNSSSVTLDRRGLLHHDGRRAVGVCHTTIRSWVDRYGDDMPRRTTFAGTIEEGQYKAKSDERRAEMAGVTEARDRLGGVENGDIDIALAVFDWSQNALESWQGSNSAVRRQILDSVSLNRTLSASNLCISKRKPFDLLAEGLDSAIQSG